MSGSSSTTRIVSATCTPLRAPSAGGSAGNSPTCESTLEESARSGRRLSGSEPSTRVDSTPGTGANRSTGAGERRHEHGVGAVAVGPQADPLVGAVGTFDGL